MTHVKYNDWLNQLASRDERVVQVRMMSSGNALTVGQPPAYGVYLADNESDDEIKDRNIAVARSSLGGGNSIDAPIEFYVRDAPIFGHLIKRAHGDGCSPKYGSNARTVGWSPSLKGADRIAYKQALKAGRKLAVKMDARIVDQTSRDLSEFADSKNLKLEDRIWNHEGRVKFQ